MNLKEPERAARRQQVIELATGRMRPAVRQEPLLTSAPTALEGIMLEQHGGQEIESRNIACPSHCFVLHLAQSAEFEIKIGSGPVRTLQKRPGHINFVPARTPVTVCTKNSGDFLMLTLEPQFFFYAVHDMTNPDNLELLPQLGLEDLWVAQTLRSLMAEIGAGNLGGRIYAESLASSLALHLALRYSTRKSFSATPGRGLSSKVLRRVIDHVHGHLAENVSLRTLADVSGLSTFHFARLFRASTGLSPHRFIIQCRVDKARDMLREGSRSIAEVALAVGFCDQSHFAMHFKRRCGKTPRAYQVEMSPNS